MIDSLDPVGELCVQILEALRTVIWQLQSAFKALLKCMKTAFDLTFAPGGVRPGMQQPDPQVGANNLRMSVNEWSAMIGVEFIRNAATLDCLLERLMERISVGS